MCVNDLSNQEKLLEIEKTQNDLIGRIYDTAVNPGEWFDLIESITEFAQPIIDENGLEVYQSPEKVENLIAHLERAARNNEYIYVLEDQKQILNTMYNNMPWPLLMLDAQMNVIDVNQSASQLLGDSASISMDKNKNLKFKDKALKDLLKKYLNLEMGRETKILQSRIENLSLLCTLLKKSDALGAISKLRAVVWVLSNENKIIPSADIIQSVFGLTVAEARLLYLLCKEGDLNKCANLLAVSVHTVRTQMKSIMAKTNVSSQVQLVSKTMGHSFLQAATKQLNTSSNHPEQRMVLPDGRVLSWFEYGSSTGRPVLAFEGLGGGIPHHPSHDAWYRKKNLRVINIIRPGYGSSTLKPDMNFKDLTGDIKALCKALNINKPIAAAYCVGSAYALCAAATEKNIFDRIGLLGATVAIEYWQLEKLDFMHKLYLQMHRAHPKIFAIFMRLAIRGLQRAPEKGYEKIAKSLGGRDYELMNDPAIRNRAIKDIQSRQFQGSEVIISEYQRLQKPWNVDLSQITIPVMMWHGENDPTISIGSACAMAAVIPGVRFKSLPGHGRLLAHDVWTDFLQELIQGE